VYDELFRDSPPTPREERLLDALSRAHLELAYLLDFRSDVTRSLGELEARRAAMMPRRRTHSAARRPRGRRPAG
jgi:hypothetical protein